jgi:hypothetical protein
LVSGDAIELWMLKTACGLYYSVASDKQAKLSNILSVNMGKVHSALFKRKWDERAGLYLNATVGDAPVISTHARFNPLGVNSRFVGVRVSFHGVELDLIFDADALNPSAVAGKEFRPGELVFRTSKRHDSVILAWTNKVDLKSVIMNRRLLGTKSN